MGFVESLLTKEDTKLKEIADYCNSKQLLVDNKALQILGKRPDFKEIVDEIISRNEFVINEASVKAIILKGETKLKNIANVEIRKSRFKPYAKEIEADCRVMDEYDVTGKTNSKGKVDDFLKFFRDKYQFLESVLNNRMGFEPVPISALKKLPKNEKIEFIGMIRERWISKNGHLFYKIEDFEGECSCWISKNDVHLNLQAERVIMDDVVGIKAVKMGDDMVAVKEILWPDLPLRQFRKTERDVSIVSISDTHVGSRLFMEKEFARFISWLNGNATSEKELEKIGKIKYLVIAGDTVDGIGIYPDQFDELAIRDIYEQYNMLSNFLEQVPEYIEVFICPGQHDAVRRADPQPAIGKEYLPRIADLKNVHLIGSPSWAEIEGLKTLVYHGASLHDLYNSVNFLDSKQPQKAIIELLKRRDLMVSYGLRQPYVPEQRDYMVIREEPDLYFGGDMHHIGYDTYRGCIIVNNSTFQKQTAFEIQKGHVPTPGIVPIVNLQNGTISEARFAAES